MRRGDALIAATRTARAYRLGDLDFLGEGERDDEYEYEEPEPERDRLLLGLSRLRRRGDGLRRPPRGGLRRRSSLR